MNAGIGGLIPQSGLWRHVTPRGTDMLFKLQYQLWPNSGTVTAWSTGFDFGQCCLSESSNFLRTLTSWHKDCAEISELLWASAPLPACAVSVEKGITLISHIKHSNFQNHHKCPAHSIYITSTSTLTLFFLLVACCVLYSCCRKWSAIHKNESIYHLTFREGTVCYVMEKCIRLSHTG